MRFSIVMPVMNRLETTVAGLELLLRHTVDDYELVVVDNASTDGTPEYLEREIRPCVPVLHLIRNQNNAGVVAALRQGCATANGEVVACLHNDVRILEPGWNRRISDLFAQIPRLGMAGLHGSRGTPDGWRRMEPYSNLVNAELHGSRLQREYLPVAILDGFCLIMSREMLERTGGFDPRFNYYAYDCDLSLGSLAAGYRNIVVNVACAHLDGETSRALGTRDTLAEREKSLAYLLGKWRRFVPVYVEDDFKLRWARIDGR